jgi:hypothetical protein
VNAGTDFSLGKFRSDIWDMRIAAGADDLNCSEWPANMRKEDFDLSGNCYACRCIAVPPAGTDFFQCCRAGKKGRHEQRLLPEIHLRGRSRLCCSSAKIPQYLN